MKIRRYGVSKPVHEKIQGICSLIAAGNIDTAEKSIAEMALSLLKQMEMREITSEEANIYFGLLDRCLDEYFEGITLTENTRNLIFEGNLLHDYGTEFGPDIESMKSSAKQILGIAEG